jgi:hypothetical protein
MKYDAHLVVYEETRWVIKVTGYGLDNRDLFPGNGTTNVLCHSPGFLSDEYWRLFPQTYRGRATYHSVRLILR